MLLVAVCATQHSSHLHNLRGKARLDVEGRIFRAMKQQPSREAGTWIRHLGLSLLQSR